jgi:hypothetical protein
VRLESKHVLDLVQFVDMAEIDPRYFERPYYLLPADETAAEGYVVIREALARGGKAGSASWWSAGASTWWRWRRSGAAWSWRSCATAAR